MADGERRCENGRERVEQLEELVRPQSRFSFVRSVLFISTGSVFWHLWNAIIVLDFFI